MRTLTRRQILQRAIFATGGLCIGFPLTLTKAKEKIVWGTILPLSGPLAVLGQGVRAAVQIAIEEINQKGGITGSPVDLITLDNMSQKNYLFPAFAKLVDEHKANFLGGLIPGIPQMNELAFSKNIIYANYYLNTLPYGKLKKTYFTTNVSAGQAVNVCTKWAYQNLGKSWSLLIDRSSLSMKMKAHFIDLTKQTGARIRKILEVSNLGDLNDIFDSGEIKELKGQVLFIQFTSNEFQNLFLRSMQELSLKRQLNIMSIVGSPFAGKGSREGDYEGIHVGMPWYWKLEKKYEKAKTFNEMFSKRLNRMPNWQEAISYETTRLILDLATKIKSINPKKLADSLEGYEFNYLRGKGKIRKDDRLSVSNYVILEGKRSGKVQDMFEIINVAKAKCRPRHCD